MLQIKRVKCINKYYPSKECLKNDTILYMNCYFSLINFKTINKTNGFPEIICNTWNREYKYYRRQNLIFKITIFKILYT